MCGRKLREEDNQWQMKRKKRILWNSRSKNKICRKGVLIWLKNSFYFQNVI
jgi:hypothetical protein